MSTQYSGYKDTNSSTDGIDVESSSYLTAITMHANA